MTILPEYVAKLQAMTDVELVKEAKNQCWHSAFASSNSRDPAHAKCDATHDEAVRRGKRWLYCQGWNAAYRACGYEPSEGDIAAAKATAA